MEEEEEHLCKVETKDDNLYLLFRKISQNRNEFDLFITDGCAMWDTRVTDDLLQEMATKVDMNLKDYALQTLKALTSPNSAKDCFIYQAVKTDSRLEFTWKKQLDDGVKYQLGSVSLNLNQESKEMMQKILDFSIKKIHEYQETAVCIKSKTEQLARDRESAISRLDKCVSSKEEMELDLFQKFVTVLNEKKAKIRRLQEAVEQQSKELSIKSQGSTALDDREDDLKGKHKGNDDTDAESDQSQNADMMEKQRATTSSNIGSSLFKDEEDIGPVLKRRRKKQTKKPSTTPSKSVLPEVKKTAVKRTASNASSTSIASNESRQTTTRRSSRRNKNTPTFPDDVEDLFGDMA